MALQFQTTLRSTWLASLITAIGASAKIEIRTSTPEANCAAADGGTLLAELTGNASAFGTEAGQVLTVSAVTQDSSANADGTAGHYRVKTSGGTVICQGTCGAVASGADMILTPVTIVSTQPVSITSWTITAPGV